MNQKKAKLLRRIVGYRPHKSKAVYTASKLSSDRILLCAEMERAGRMVQRPISLRNDCKRGAYRMLKKGLWSHFEDGLGAGT